VRQKKTDFNEERLLKRDCENRPNNCTIVKAYTRSNPRYRKQHKYRLLYCSTEFVLLKFKRLKLRVKHLCTPRASFYNTIFLSHQFLVLFTRTYP